MQIHQCYTFGYTGRYTRNTLIHDTQQRHDAYMCVRRVVCHIYDDRDKPAAIKNQSVWQIDGIQLIRLIKSINMKLQPTLG